MAYKYVTGVREVRDQFKKIKNGLDVPMRSTLQKAARPVVSTAKKNAPRESGILRKSLKLWRVPRMPKGSVTYLIGAAGKARFYAHLAEWGRMGHYKGSRFMTKTFDDQAPNVIERFTSLFPEELEKRIKYLAKKGKTL
jgi:HK97 gp10 family phage protein